METFFNIAILLVSVVLHEVSHGYAAVFLGDPTPRYANRLTVNPLPHLDPIGSILLPLLLVLSNAGFVFAWAKPVPFNPYNLRGKWGEAIVAAAGPAANLFIAVVFSLVIRFFGEALGSAALNMMFGIVTINLFLAIFNLVPIPPLDGSKLLFSLLPYRYQSVRFALEQYGFFLIIIFVFFFADILIPIVGLLLGLLTGISLF